VPVTARARLGSTLDLLAQATVIASFSRVGLTVRSRLLPEFTAAPPPAAGRVVLITGATSGIGHAAAVALACQGATVHFLARDRGRAERAQRQIKAASGSPFVSYGLADLEDLGSVRAFAREFRSAYSRLDILIHNAATIHPSYRTDPAGIELTYAGQVVAPFLLTAMLLPRLRTAGAARVITVSSGGMYTKRLDLTALPPAPAGFRGVTAYAQVKRAQVVLSAEWARRVAGTDVAFHAMHPGWADTPGIAAALPRFRRVMRPLLRTPEQGADTITWLATADPALLGSGGFWHDRRRRPEYLLPWTREDASARNLLWERCARAAVIAPPVPFGFENDIIRGHGG
jgi:NAD(P)-dependent dehydrogenase (short-subunit alcohol dehydrogenase family)